MVHVSSQYLVVGAWSKVIRSGQVPDHRAIQIVSLCLFATLLFLKLSHFLLDFVMRTLET